MNRLLPPQKRLTERILNQYSLKTSEDSLILEVGCGLGDFLEIISKNRKIIGLDINEEAIMNVNETIKNPLFQKALVYDGLNFPFEDESFDMVYSSEVIEHVQDDKNFLEECFRVTKKNGIFILTTPNISKQPHIELFDGHVRHYSKYELINKLEKTGFSVEKFYWRIHPVCNFLDELITTKGRDHLKKEDYLGHNVQKYTDKDSNSSMMINFYKILEPLIKFVSIFEFEILKNHMDAINMVAIAKK